MRKTDAELGTILGDVAEGGLAGCVGGALAGGAVGFATNIILERGGMPSHPYLYAVTGAIIGSFIGALYGAGRSLSHHSVADQRTAREFSSLGYLPPLDETPDR